MRCQILFSRIVSKRIVSSHIVPLALFCVVLACSSLDARGFRISQVPNGEIFGCDLCHDTPGGPRNDFGDDVEDTLTELGDVDWSALFDIDSDGDGYLNGEEMGDPDGDGVPEEGVTPSHPAFRESFPGPDIVVLVEVNRVEVDTGDIVGFTIDVFNIGSRTATETSLRIDLPAGVSIEDLDAGGADCAESDGALVCDLGESPPQFGARILVNLRFESAPGEVDIELVTLLAEDDINPSNNSAGTVITVRGDGGPRTFHRGDGNVDGVVDISDALYVFGFLFLGEAPPSCDESADTNNDGRIDISDGVALLTFLFAGGEAPAAPGPSGEPCGVDPDLPGSAGDLGCDAYAPCVL